ncbi:MAG: hypothetical protein JNL96_04085, partial [Planctomycetaceae bacterium]|nr:hypothetical protein [Planctomycetaceae bacterium]
MKHSASYRTSTTVTPCHTAGMGFVAIADVAERRRIASFDAGKFLAVVDGEILNVRELRAAGESADAGDAEFVLREYRRHGTAFIARLEGKFSAAIWDGDRRRLLLIADRFGMKPLFYRRRDKRLAFGAEAKTLFSSVLRPRTDVRSLAIFLSYGQLLEDRTLYQEVRVLPAAHILSIEADTGSSELQRYWRPEPTRRSPTIRADEILEQLDGAFQRSVDRATRDTNGLGISLSGGLDGRTMMAAIDHERIPITSLCSGMPGSLDHRCARKISELTNRRHDEHALDLGFLGNYDRYIKWMVHLTDGQYLDQGIVIPTLARYRELGIRVLLRGHAGEMLHMDKAYNFSVDESALAIRSQEELERWCLTRLQGFMLDGVETRLLRDLSLSEMRAISAESLRRCLSESDYLEHPLDRLTHLFLSQRSRRETAMSLTIFGSTLETRVPYLDREIVEYVLSLPSSYRIGDRIQTA